MYDKVRDKDLIKKPERKTTAARLHFEIECKNCRQSIPANTRFYNYRYEVNFYTTAYYCQCVDCEIATN